MEKKNKKPGQIISQIIIYAALLILAISIIVPVAWVFMASLKMNSEFLGGDISPWALPKTFRYQNFVTAFIDGRMGEFFMNSVLVTAMALIILLALALPASYVLSRFEFKSRKFLNALFMAGLFVNISYIVIPIFLMLSSANRALGVEFFLNNRFILAVVYASSALPFTVYLLSGYFKTLPKIMIPMAKPSIITVILFNFLSFWNEYIIAYTLMDGNDTLAMGLKNLMAVEKAATNYGIMYAGLVTVMLPTLILYILVQKQLTEGMTLGGLKG